MQTLIVVLTYYLGLLRGDSVYRLDTNAQLTPTLKIKRNRIESDVGPKLQAWYAGRAKVQWA
jgi:hypothetical protein